MQVFQADRFLARGALTLQGDGYRRFEYNPRLVDIAQGIPARRHRRPQRRACSPPAIRPSSRRTGRARAPGGDPAGGGRAAGARPTRYYPFGGRTFHLLGDLNDRTNWAAPNTSYAERDSRIRLQGYDDFAGVVDVHAAERQDRPARSASTTAS